MKKTISVLTILLTIGVSTGLAQYENETDAIKKAIQEGYVDGLQNYGDTDLTRKYIYPGFFYTALTNNQITHFPIYNWIENVEKVKMEGKVPARKITVEFVQIDITGNAGMAKIRLFENGTKLLFTDYLLLYRFEDNWKIVQKTFFRHPAQ